MYILFFILAVLIWGTDAAITKRFLFNAIDPIPMVTLRMTIATVALLPFVIREFRSLRSFTRKDCVRLLVLAVVGTVGMNLLFYGGLVRTPAFIALILFRLEPVFVILISALFMRQRTSVTTVLLTLATIAAGAVVSLGGSGRVTTANIDILGIGLILLGSVCSAIGTIVAKDLLAASSPSLLNCLRTGLASLVLLSWMGRPLVVDILPALPARDLALLIFMGVVFSSVAFWLYYKGLQYTAPLVGAQLQLLRIVSGLLASMLLLGEIPTAVQWAGAAALSVLLYYLTKPGAEPAAAQPAQNQALPG